MRERALGILTTILELAGAGLVVFGVSLISTPAAVILAGLCLVAIGVLAP